MASFFKWCRGTESNAPEAQHGDFQTKFLKIQKYSDSKQLILFQFFIVFLVSFGTIWKYLTLTGTIWAQFNADHHYPLQNLFFTRKDPHDSQSVRDIVRCTRFDISGANQAQYDTPGSPLIYPSICDPWFPVGVFLRQPKAV